MGSGLLTVDDGGQPFRTAHAAAAADNPYAIPVGDGEWMLF